MKNERDVEGASCGIGGLLTVKHPEEVGGVGERLVGFDDGFPFPDAVEDSNDHRDLRCEAEGFANVSVVGAVSFVRVIDAEKRDCSAEDLHWSGVGWDASEQVDDLWI